MLEILVTERRTTAFTISGLPITKMFYYVVCPVCFDRFWILKYNHPKMKSCKNCRGHKHGDCRRKLYKVFTTMKQRCTNPKDPRYHCYGGKGVRGLFSSYPVFKEWALANGYQEDAGLSIDRIDVNGNYEPDNCRWISLSLNSSLPHRKAVIQCHLDTKLHIQKFVSAAEACKQLGIDSSGILKVCRGTRNKAGGYYWHFV